MRVEQSDDGKLDENLGLLAVDGDQQSSLLRISTQRETSSRNIKFPLAGVSDAQMEFKEEIIDKFLCRNRLVRGILLPSRQWLSHTELVERHCLVSHTVNLVQGKYEDNEFNNYAQTSQASGSIIEDQ